MSFLNNKYNCYVPSIQNVNRISSSSSSSSSSSNNKSISFSNSSPEFPQLPLEINLYIQNLFKKDLNSITPDELNTLFNVYNMSGFDRRKFMPTIISIKNWLKRQSLPHLLYLGISPDNENIRNKYFLNALSEAYTIKANIFVNNVKQSQSQLGTGNGLLFTYSYGTIVPPLKLSWFPRNKILYDIVENLNINGHAFTDLKYFIPFTNLKVLELENGDITNVKDLCRFRELTQINVNKNKIADVDAELNFIGNKLKHIKLIKGNPIETDKSKIHDLKMIFKKHRLFCQIESDDYDFEALDDYHFGLLLENGVQNIDLRDTLTDEATRLALDEMSREKTDNYEMMSDGEQFSVNWIPTNIILCNITTKIHISDHEFVDLSPFFPFTKLTSLILIVGPLNTLEGIGRFTDLTTLDIRQNSINEIRPNTELAKLKNLKEFDITGNPILEHKEKMSWVLGVLFYVLKFKKGHPGYKGSFEVKTEEEQKKDFEEIQKKKRIIEETYLGK